MIFIFQVLLLQGVFLLFMIIVMYSYTNNPNEANLI